jgi:protein O-mannosyl-transferase
LKSQLKRRVTKPARAVAVPAKSLDRDKHGWRPLLAGCVLLLLSTLPYLNSLPNGFVWDDHQQMVMNPDLRPGADLSRLFSAGVWGYLHKGSQASNIYYRPLQMSTYRAVIAAEGVNPVAFHLVSLIFAATCVLVAFAFFRKLTQQQEVAFVAAALFAVHPVHTEAVDWISALPDIGCTLFLVVAFLLFLLLYGNNSQGRGFPKRSSARWMIWVLSVACFAAALLWKETAVVFPLLIAFYVFLFPGGKRTFSRARAAGMSSLPFWIVLAGYLLVRVGVLGRVATSQRNWQLPPLAVILTAADLMASYWWKLLVPARLNAYHVFSPTRSLLDPRAVAGILFVAVACGLIVYLARRRPLIAFSAAWVFITLLPVMDIYAVGRNVFAERYLYLPSVGFCLLVTLLAFEGLRQIPLRFRKWAVIAALIAIVLPSALEIVARNPDWKDDATLFSRTLETSPNAPFAHNMVAASESDHSASLASAEEHYLKAISFASVEDPPDRVQMAMAFKGLASIYSDRSDFKRSLEMVGRAREAAPDDPEIDGEQGLILTRAGRWDEAEKYLQRAVANSPDDVNVLNALGIFAQQHSHELDRAAGYFRRALAVHTDQDDFKASLHNNLGTVYGEQRRYEDAITEFKSAIAVVPTDLEYRTNLAMALAANGRYDDARAEIRAILVVDPSYEPARTVLRQLVSR